MIRMKWIAFLVVLFAGWAPSGQAKERAQAQLTFSAAMDSLQRRFEAIRDYQVDVHAVVNVEGIRVPPMDATVFFKQPDHIHVEARGFAMLPRHAVAFSPALLRRMLEKGRILSQSWKGPHRFEAKVAVREPRTMQEAVFTLEIDTQRWLLVRVRIESERFGWMEVRNEFGKVAGKYLLPVKSRVLLNLNRDVLPRFGGPHSRELRSLRDNMLGQFGGKGVVYLTFLHYRVNEGLPDSVFGNRTK